VFRAVGQFSYTHFCRFDITGSHRNARSTVSHANERRTGRNHKEITSVGDYRRTSANWLSVFWQRLVDCLCFTSMTACHTGTVSA